MFRFIHAADLHLDSPLKRLECYEGAPVKEVRLATRRALKTLVDLALEVRAGFVCFSGDLYDADWKDYNTGLFFISQMARLGEAGIRFFVVSGNHDAANAMTRKLRLPDSGFSFPADRPGTVVLDDLRTAIHGQGYDRPAVTENLALGFPAPVPGYFNIGMLHTCLCGYNGHEPYVPCTESDLELRGYDYWALGHVHKRQIIRQQPFIGFPGNLQGRHVREPGAKGCFLVEVDDGGGCSVDFRAMDTVRWQRVGVDVGAAESAPGAVDLAVDGVEQCLEGSEGRTVVVRLELGGDCPALQDMSARLEHWTGEVRSRCLSRFGSRIMVEKVTFVHREDHVPVGGTVLPEGPLDELRNVLRELRSHPERLEADIADLKKLSRSLPPDFFDDALLDPENPDWLEKRLGETAPFLLQRLRTGGDG